MERIKEFSHKMRTLGIRVSTAVMTSRTSLSPKKARMFCTNSRMSPLPVVSLTVIVCLFVCLFVCLIIICYLFQVFRKLPSTVRKIVSDPCCNMILGV